MNTNKYINGLSTRILYDATEILYHLYNYVIRKKPSENMHNANAFTEEFIYNPLQLIGTYTYINIM